MLKKLIVLLLPTLLCSSNLFSQISFSSNFESGSFGEALLLDSLWFSTDKGDSTFYISYQVNSRFDPLNPVDTSLNPSARWYYFRMDGVKDKMVHIRIKNSEAIRPFYSYDGKEFDRFSYSENPEKGLIVKKFERDTVYISHFKPYTWSRHKEKLDEWSAKASVKRETIGKSTLGLPIEMLTITDTAQTNSIKKKIWIHGRSHPSEHPASWHLEALVDMILSDSEESQDLRKNSIIYLVPFINPDGVYGGYSRSSSTGVNLEVNWDTLDSLTMPEVKALKNKLEDVTSDRPLDLLLNMHSQIANSVTYWIHNAKSTTDKFLQRQLLLSALTMGERKFYREEDQSFSAIAPRYVEGWVWDKFKEATVAITFETPYTYYAENPNGIWVSIDNLKDLAKDSFYAIYDFLMIPGGKRVILEPYRFIGRGWKGYDDNSRTYFGENYRVNENQNGKVVFRHDNLKEGSYKIFNYRENRWIEIDSITQKKSGKFVWRAKSSIFKGEVDAILLIKQEN